MLVCTVCTVYTSLNTQDIGVIVVKNQLYLNSSTCSSKHPIQSHCPILLLWKKEEWGQQ